MLACPKEAVRGESILRNCTVLYRTVLYCTGNTTQYEGRQVARRSGHLFRLTDRIILVPVPVTYLEGRQVARRSGHLFRLTDRIILVPVPVTYLEGRQVARRSGHLFRLTDRIILVLVPVTYLEGRRVARRSGHLFRLTVCCYTYCIGTYLDSCEYI